MRSRILIFIATLIALAVFKVPNPWAVVAGCAVYTLVVFPALKPR